MLYFSSIFPTPLQPNKNFNLKNNNSTSSSSDTDTKKTARLPIISPPLCYSSFDDSFPYNSYTQSNGGDNNEPPPPNLPIKRILSTAAGGILANTVGQPLRNTTNALVRGRTCGEYSAWVRRHPLGLWNGLGAIMKADVPKRVVMLNAYDGLKDLIRNGLMARGWDKKTSAIWGSYMAVFGISLADTAWMVEAESKSDLCINKNGQFRFDTLTIKEQHQVLKRAFLPQLCRDICSNKGSFPFALTLAYWLEGNGAGNHDQPWIKFSTVLLGGMITQIPATIFDATRIYRIYHLDDRSSLIQTVTKCVKDGTAFKGLIPRVIRIPLVQAVTLGTAAAIERFSSNSRTA